MLRSDFTAGAFAFAPGAAANAGWPENATIATALNAKLVFMS
jgi:hypothetical protein